MSDFEVVCWSLTLILIVANVLIRIQTRRIRKETSRKDRERATITTKDEPTLLWPVETQEFICDVTRNVPVKIKVLEERIAILERLRTKIE